MKAAARSVFGVILAAVLGCALLAPSAGYGAVVISEFMAVNNATIADENGEFSDWLELHNDGAVQVDLEGWCLTDDADNPARWRLPAISLAADGYLLIFASGKDRALPGNPLHTNFKLSGAGEYLALVEADGQTVAQEFAPEYPPQTADVSYGLAGSETGFLEYPTPGLPNATQGLFFVSPLRFSHGHGFYDGPFDLEIGSETAGAVIHYTTDGRTPGDATGALYTGPLPIAKTTVLRAVAFRTGYRSSPRATRTYIFPADVLSQDGSGLPETWGVDRWGMPGSIDPTYEPIPADYEMDPEVTGDPRYKDSLQDDLKSLPTMSLVVHPEDLFDASSGIYANPGERVVDPAHPEGGPRLEWEKPVSIELLYPDGREGFQVDGGIRVHGGASRYPLNSRKLSFRLLFKSEYGPSELAFPLFGASAAERLNTLVLKAGAGDSWQFDPTPEMSQYLRDAWHRDTQEAMGHPSTHSIFVHLYLNGLYWGLYQAMERVDASFMAAYLGGDEEEYDVVKSSFSANGLWDAIEAQDGNLDKWEEVIALANAGLAGDAEYQALADSVDIDNLIDYMLFNLYSGNRDWMPSNWVTARERVEGAKFTFFSWDAEMALRLLEAYRVGVGQWPVHDRTPARLYWRLRDHDEYRILFADAVHRHLFHGGALTPGEASARYLRRAAAIDRAIVCESARWGDVVRELPFTRDGAWLAEQSRLVQEFFPQRAAIVVAQLRGVGLYPGLDAPVFLVNGVDQHGGEIAAGAELTMEATAAVYYTLDGTDPRAVGGGFAAAARRHYTPLVLEQTQQIKARSLDQGVWSALSEATFVIAGGVPLALTELMVEPPEGGDYEFIELHNQGTAEASLAGIRFASGVSFDFTGSAVGRLAAGEFVLVVSNRSAFEARYGSGFNIAGQYTGRLDNAGEHIRLEDGLGQALVEFDYDSGRGWPVAAAGAGHSLVPQILIGQADGALDYGAHWRASAYRGGSPGREDPVPAAGLLLNEFVANTDYSDPGHPEYDSNDWIELYNPTSSEIALAGWFLSDDVAQPAKWAIPAGAIPAGGHVSFDEVTGFHQPLTSGFGLDKDGEQLLLSWLPGTQEDRVADAIRFKAQEEAVSLGRYPDVGEHWHAMSPTRDAANSNPLPRVVISEIMYHPDMAGEGAEDATAYEFVELYNPTSTEIPLQNSAGVWRLNGGVDFQFPDDTRLPSRGVLLVVGFDPADSEALEAFKARYALGSPEAQVVGPYAGALSNRGERVALEKPLEPLPAGEPISWVIVDEAIYFDRSPWPPSADGEGDSLHRNAFSGSGNNPSSWNAGRPGPGSVSRGGSFWLVN